jgi:hypothetical protein
MKKFSLLAVAAMAVVLVLSAEQADARGGGARGGARPGGGHGFRPQGGNFSNRNFGGGAAGQGAKASNLGSKAGNVAGKAQGQAAQAKSNFANKSQPFSPSWYANHPRAWQATHPHADAWAVAGFGTAAAWLGITAAAANGSTVYTSDATDAAYEGDDMADDNSELTDEQTTADDSASELAKRGAAPTGNAADFLSLGVFKLSPQGQPNAWSMINLAVSKSGIVRGTYYDILSDQEQPIQGAIDKATQRVAFTIGTQGTIVFQTLLPDLTRDNGTITLQYNDGTKSQWTLSRQQDTTRTEQ